VINGSNDPNSASTAASSATSSAMPRAVPRAGGARLQVEPRRVYDRDPRSRLLGIAAVARPMPDVAADDHDLGVLQFSHICDHGHRGTVVVTERRCYR